MRNFFWTVLVAGLLLLVSSGSGAKTVTYLQERNGLKYEVNQEEPFTGKFVEYWGNGQKKTEEHYRNGKWDGLQTNWHENGQKSLEANFKNGELDGLAAEWYENGQKWREGNFKNGKEDGLRTVWHENGKKSSVKNYKNGELVETICDGNC